jgi:hypothetical protein
MPHHMNRPEVFGTIAALCLYAFWFIGAYVRMHWYGILRWSHRREVRRQERNGNPYQTAWRRGFWYGLFVGASLVGVAWRLFR